MSGQVIAGVAAVAATAWLAKKWAFGSPPAGYSEAVAALRVGEWRKEAFGNGLMGAYYQCQPMAGCTIVSRSVALPLKDGSLWLMSPGPITEDTRELLRNSSGVHLCNGSAAHNFFLEPLMDACKDLGKPVTLYTRAALLEKLPQLAQREEVPVVLLEDDGVYPWSQELANVNILGNRSVCETVFLHRDSRTLLCTDAFQNMEQVYGSSRLINFVFRCFGAFGEHEGRQLVACPPLRVGSDDVNLLRQSVRKVAQWDFDNAMLCHVKPVVGGAKELFLRGPCRQLGVDVDGIKTD